MNQEKNQYLVRRSRARERTNLVTNVSTIQADLVLVVSEGSVESSEFSKLVPLVIVLSLGSGSSLTRRERTGKEESEREREGEDEEGKRKKTHRRDDSVNQVHTSSNLLRIVGRHQAMQILLSVVTQVLGSSLPLLHTSLPSNRDLRSTLLLHLLLRVSTRTE